MIISFSQAKLIFFPCKKNNYRPKLLSNRFLLSYAIILLLLKLIIIPFLFYFPETIFFADITKARLIEFTNNARQNLGLNVLKENQTLNEAAYLKAQDMVAKGYFDHYSPEGISPWYWLQKINYNYKSAGENLAIGFLESEQAHQAWMDSISHRQNILNPIYEEIGIAVLKDNFQGRETTLVVQYFGTPKIMIPVVSVSAPEPIQEIIEPEITKPEIIQEEIIQEEIIEEEIPTQVAAEETIEKEEITLSTVKEFEKTPSFVLFQFMTSKYYDLIQVIIYASLFFIIFSLLITFYCDLFIYHKYVIKYKDIIFKGISYIVLWSFVVFLDKMIIIQLFTQHFRIN
ncbi:MAG: CAP domain-containing protein [Candidatus Pacebacteria bacterium]|nr:CAP domain-containing protein [Candidatus Paceibacterota bacterium]